MSTTQHPEALRDARWYMIDKDGMATLCTDMEDAEKEAKDANMAWPHTAPHRAVQLVEAADVEALRSGYAAARLEIESLQARIKAMAEEHADELMVAHLDGRMRAAQPAPATQQASQHEPFAWCVTGCGRLLDEYEAKAEARHIGGTARAVPLYTAPQADSQPAVDGWTDADADAARLALELECLLMDTKDAAAVSKWWASANDALEMHRARLKDMRHPAQAADSVLEDAARYRYLRDGDWREHEELESVIRLQLNTLWDAKIDAARKEKS